MRVAKTFTYVGISKISEEGDLHIVPVIYNAPEWDAEIAPTGCEFSLTQPSECEQNTA
jgi:hypothetical protein